MDPRMLAVWSFLFGGVSSVFAAVPEVQDVKMVQDIKTRETTISYTLKDAPGIITLDILTNGVSIGSGNIQYVSGDVNRLVEPGARTIQWRPDRSWPGHIVSNATACVEAWSPSQPPNYMVVDLLIPTNISYYVSEDSLPGGISNDDYRSKKLVMRQIVQPNGGRWTMGETRKDSRKCFEALLNHDYWMGVFEVTQAQWEQFMGNPSKSVAPDHPVENVTYTTIRGETNKASYPQPPQPDSFIGKLRAHTGLSFDLPGESEWEYACRATTATQLNNGKDLTDGPISSFCPNLAEIGRYWSNGGEKEGHTRVGSYAPNLWGLYDMHGNVWECCLDWFVTDISHLQGAVNTDKESSSTRVSRGGSFYNYKDNCTSSRRGTFNPWEPENFKGLRLACPLVE